MYIPIKGDAFITTRRKIMYKLDLFIKIKPTDMFSKFDKVTSIPVLIFFFKSV